MTKKFKFSMGFVLMFLTLSAVAPGALHAEKPPEKPLWEFGLFNTAIQIPHYRGSDEHTWYVLPLPYIIYRGDFFRADREGLRGIFYDSEHFETSVSLSGSTPVDDDNDAREGMSDLDAVVEAGPALKWHPLGRDPLDALYLNLAARAAFSAGFDHGLNVSYRGLRYGLDLVYANQSLFAEHDLKFRIKAGVDFSNSELNGYYYDVPLKDARPDRPYYKADAGYSGFSMSFSCQKKLTEKLSLGFYSRWDNVSGAVYDDSPLVKRDNVYTVGAALIWKIVESKKMVAISE